MRTTSFEEASRCPKCNNPGRKIDVYPADDGRIWMMECSTSTCLWYEERYAVQQLSNGEVPIREKSDKQFQPLSEFAKTSARANIEQMQEQERRGVKEIRWQ